MANAFRGASTVYASIDGSPLIVETPSRYIGDYVFLALTTGNPNGPDLPVGDVELIMTPSMSELVTAQDSRFRFRLMYMIVDEAVQEGPITIWPAPWVAKGSDTIFAAQAWVWGGIDHLTPPHYSGPFTAANGDGPGVTPELLDGETSLIFGLNANPAVLPIPLAFQTDDITPPSSAGFTSIGIGASFNVGFYEFPYQLAAFATGAPAAPPLSEYAYVSFTLVPAASPFGPAQAPPGVLRLGVPETYDVFITRVDEVRMPQIVDRVGWSNITWNRVLDDISEATVDIPDQYGGVYCCAKLGGLVPWRYGLRIERDATLVWEGPITGVGRPSGEGPEALKMIRVRAQDMLVRFTKRLAVHGFTKRYINSDAGTIFSDIVNTTARYPADPIRDGFILNCPKIVSNMPITREIVARSFDYAWEILKDLLDSALDGYVMNGLLHLWQRKQGWLYHNGRETVVVDGPTDARSRELMYGLFTESSWSSRPGWDLNGESQGNVGWEPGDDNGADGFRRYWTAQDALSVADVGELDVVDPNPLYRSVAEGVTISDAAYQHRVNSLVAHRSKVPAIISGGSLGPEAPIDVDGLRPGGIWRIDYYDNCFGELLQKARLKRVEVNVSMTSSGAIEERVSPTLFPVGYTEADL